MTMKKDTKTVSKPKTAITVKPKPAAKPVLKKKDSSILIKTAKTVGGILGKVAGTAHNVLSSPTKLSTEILTPDIEITPEPPKELMAKKTVQIAAKSEPKPKTPTKIKTVKTKK